MRSQATIERTFFFSVFAEDAFLVVAGLAAAAFFLGAALVVDLITGFFAVFLTAFSVFSSSSTSSLLETGFFSAFLGVGLVFYSTCFSKQWKASRWRSRRTSLVAVSFAATFFGASLTLPDRPLGRLKTPSVAT